MNVLINYVDVLLQEFPKSSENNQLKEAILAQILDKYEDLIDSGKGETEAIGIVISQFGDVDELKEAFGVVETNHPDDVLTQTDINAFLSFYKKAGHFIGFGTILIVLGIIFAVLARRGAIGLIAFFILLAVATGIFVNFGLKIQQFQQILSGDFTLRKTEERYVKGLMVENLPTFQKGITIGVVLCITGIILSIFFFGFRLPTIEIDGLRTLHQLRGMIPMLILIAPAIYLFILNGMVNGSYWIILNGNTNKTYHVNAQKFGWIYGVTMPLAFMLFLVLSWNRWHELLTYPTWVIFPITALLTHGLIEILGRRQ